MGNMKFIRSSRGVWPLLTGTSPPRQGPCRPCRPCLQQHRGSTTPEAELQPGRTSGHGCFLPHCGWNPDPRYPLAHLGTMAHGEWSLTRKWFEMSGIQWDPPCCELEQKPLLPCSLALRSMRNVLTSGHRLWRSGRCLRSQSSLAFCFAEILVLVTSSKS